MAGPLGIPPALFPGQPLYHPGWASPFADLQTGGDSMPAVDAGLLAGSRKKSPFVTVLCVLLAVIMVAEVCVAGFWKPGWFRSEEEVAALMDLLKVYLEDFAKEADTENIVIRVLGSMKELSEELQDAINRTVERTKDNTGIIFNIALNYGGRNEIVNATRQISEEALAGKIKPEDIDEEMLSKHMYTKGEPDPDLLIRTSGELRLSGFLPWQSTYSELYFVDKLWPDFDEKDLDEAIKVYSSRNRKFGAK